MLTSYLKLKDVYSFLTGWLTLETFFSTLGAVAFLNAVDKNLIRSSCPKSSISS